MSLTKNLTRNIKKKTRKTKQLLFSSQRSEPGNIDRSPPRSDAILSVGGVNPFQPEVELQSRLVEQFLPRDNCWTTMTRLPDGRHHHGAVLMNKAIYIIGGDLAVGTSVCSGCFLVEVYVWCLSDCVKPSSTSQEKTW